MKKLLLLVFILFSFSVSAQPYIFTIWDAQQFGAKEDGTTDDTAILNSTLSSLSTAVGHHGQIGYLQITGVTRFCGLIIPPNTVIDFKGGQLEVTDTCSATYPISSENYATNLSNNYQCFTNADVPSRFGFNNANIDCNKANATYPGACISFYGPSKIFSGINTIANALNTPAITTSNTTIPGNPSDQQCQEEDHIDTLITIHSAGKGWDNSSHDTSVGTFISAYDGDCGFTGGFIDHADLFHSYGGLGTDCGVEITGPFNADVVNVDGETLEVPSTQIGGLHISHLQLFNVGYGGATYAVNNQSGNFRTDSVDCVFDPSATNTTCIINGTASTNNADNVNIHGFKTLGSSNAGLKGIVNYGSGENFTDLQIGGLSGSGSEGFEENAGNNTISGYMNTNKTMIAIGSGASGTGDIVSLNMFTTSGETDVSGIIPSNSTFRIRCQGSGSSCHNFDSVSSPIGIGTSYPIVSLDDSQNTDAIALPIGTTGTRPSPAYNGMVRYNSTGSPAIEAYVNNAWSSLSTNTGTVTNIATTSPLGGGPITTTGTVTCSTCVVASSPGAGIAHFAGSTQTVTSSAISLTADVSGVLAVANGGTNSGSAGISAFNNITGYTASGATGTTSTNLVFSASPSITGTLSAAAETLSGNLTLAGGSQIGIGTSSPQAAVDNYAFNGGGYLSRDFNVPTVLKMQASGGTNYIQSATSLSSGNGATLAFTDMNVTNTWMTISGSGVVTISVSGVVLGKSSSTPSHTATCTAGTFWWDSGFIYVCVVSGTVKRATLNTF